MSRKTLWSLIAGAAGAVALSGTVVVAAALLGLMGRPGLMVLAATVLATGIVAYTAGRDLEGISFRVGAAGLIPLALVWELVSANPGIGPVQGIAVVAGALVAVVGPGAVRSVVLRPVSRPVAMVAVSVAAGLLVAMFLRIVFDGGALGHDESAYALKARAWLEGTPDTGWSLHRAIGQSVVAAAVLPFSHDPVALRTVAVVISLATVMAVWWLGKVFDSERAGLIAAGVYAVAPSFLRRGAEFLTDVPSTGLLVVATALLWRWLRATDGSSDRDLFLSVGAGALAVYMRYQSVLALGLITLAAILTHPHRVRSRMAAVIGASSLGIALLVPHFVFAVAITGRPWGIVTRTAEGVRSFPGEGIIDYARDFPDLFAGQLGALAIVVALAWGVTSRGAQRRRAAFLILPAVGHLLVLGLVAHGEPRFAFFPVALMTVAAGTAFVEWQHRHSGDAARAVSAALIVAVAASLALHGLRMDVNAENRGRSFAALAAAADSIRAESGDACSIVTGLQPQMTWLSGCRTEPYHADPADLRVPESDRGYLVLAEGGPRQPEGDLLAAYLDLTDGEPVRFEGWGSIGDVTVWRLAANE